MTTTEEIVSVLQDIHATADRIIEKAAASTLLEIINGGLGEDEVFVNAIPEPQHFSFVRHKEKPSMLLSTSSYQKDIMKKIKNVANKNPQASVSVIGANMVSGAFRMPTSNLLKMVLGRNGYSTQIHVCVPNKGRKITWLPEAVTVSEFVITITEKQFGKYNANQNCQQYVTQESQLAD